MRPLEGRINAESVILQNHSPGVHEEDAARDPVDIVRICDQLPLTASGKVLKTKLRALAREDVLNPSF
jgi:hypothetical protein